MLNFSSRSGSSSMKIHETRDAQWQYSFQDRPYSSYFIIIHIEQFSKCGLSGKHIVLVLVTCLFKPTVFIQDLCLSCGLALLSSTCTLCSSGLRSWLRHSKESVIILSSCHFKARESKPNPCSYGGEGVPGLGLHMWIWADTEATVNQNSLAHLELKEQLKLIHM